MKALKERRTSLRSLVRRGLVILSLFALVFAVSCGGSEGSSSSPGEGGNTPPVETRKVVEMKIVRSPTIYSFQGMAPDLTGLVVEVKWSDGTTYEQITDTTQFYTVPSVIEDKATTSVMVFHNSNKEYYVSASIPLVVAIKSADITGKGLANETIYEDEDVNTAGMTLNARYNPIPERDSGSYKWDGVATETIKQLPVYSNANRWNFKDTANSKVASYIVVPAGPLNTPPAIEAPFQFDNYYRVDKITLNNSGTFPKFAADDTVYTNPSNATDPATTAWLDLLETAGVTFDVTYYDNPTVKTKTMADYKRAFSMTDQDGNFVRKASFPKLSYANFVAALTDGLGINVFLQYYDKGINATTGAPENTEPKPNQMMITFPPESILENTGVVKEWKLSVPEYNAQVIAAPTNPQGQTQGLLKDLKDALGTYYDVYRVYSNAAGDQVRVKIPFDTELDDPDDYGTGWGGYAFADFDPTLNDGNPAILPGQVVIMNVPNPASLGGNTPGDFEVEFLYDIHPPKPNN